jgi:hypothetical protein
MHPSTDLFAGMPWGRPGMRNYREAWFPEGLELIVKIVRRLDYESN